MNSFDFRSIMMERLRAFEKWAWLDSTENPNEWDFQSMEFQEWMEMFDNWLQGDNA